MRSSTTSANTSINVHVAAARNLYQKLYGVEPPCQMPLLGLQGE